MLSLSDGSPPHPLLARHLEALPDLCAGDAERVRGLLDAVNAALHESDTASRLAAGPANEMARLVVAARALRESDERFRAVVENMREVLITADVDDVIIYANARVRELLGYDPEELIGRQATELLFLPDRVAGIHAKQQRRLSGETERYESPLRRKDGSVVWADISAAPYRDAQGRAIGTMAAITDITDRREAEAVQAETLLALQRGEARFRALFDHAAVGICEVDLAGMILESNSAFQRIVGYTAEELRGRSSSSLSSVEDANVTRLPVEQLRAGTLHTFTVDKRFVRKDHHVIWGRLTVSAVDEGNGPVRLVGMLQDITEQRALEEQLTRQAFHDPLTGLANRALFRDRAAHALERDVRAHAGIAVLFVDLDGFKLVNDTIGHDAGDQLLERVGARLTHCMRGGDTVARLGSDEFAVLLEQVHDDAEALAVADRILMAMRGPILLEDREVFVGVSVGIAFGRDAGSGDDLLSKADEAMYAAKAEGKGRYALFEPEMHARAVERQQVEIDLRPALARGEFRVVYQPVVELATGGVAGIEALVRWQHPTRGFIAPDRFIGIAEDTGLIVPIGRWVLREACRQGAGWRDRLIARGDDPTFTMGVNISARQLLDQGFVDDVRTILEETGMLPELLMLEITESVIMHDLEATTLRLAALKALGVRLAIDDFGTGYSSLGYLQRFPLDVLKIDKTFTDGIGHGPQHAALVRTIVALCETLELRTIAEGIETEDQHAALLALGCELGQGYHFSRPLVAGEIGPMLDRRAVTV